MAGSRLGCRGPRAHPDLQAQNLGALFEKILDGHSGMPRDLVKLGTVGQDHVPGRERLR